MNEFALIAAEQFNLQGIIEKVTPFPGGNIHESFYVKTAGEENPDYLLQHKNQYVFRNVPAMMENIEQVTKHLKHKISESGGDPQRETITLLRTQDDKPFFCDESGEYWALCIFIKDSFTYEKVTSNKLASGGGKCVGRFQSMLSDFNKPLTDILPGYHNMKFRFTQWDQALNKDIAGRRKKLDKEIQWIEERRGKMLEFWDRIEQGRIPERVAHNDTKISNILFDKNQEAFCVIDLDTVLSSTILNDFGDSIRTYTNTGMEDDPDPGKVSMDMNIFKAYTEGYLSEALAFLSREELENLAYSALYITFEQTLRFLMDYINGDKYYKIRYPEHNIVRTRAQYKLLQSMEEQHQSMREIVKKYSIQSKK